jgi:D-glycero-D-manno-heptose 1,7-bisphosphate phosphatase
MRRAVFLDRDGVINAAIYNPAEGKLDSPQSVDEFRVLPGAAKAVRMINGMGFLAIVVSNQPGVAKGKCHPELLAEIDERLEASLADEGARLDGIYYCLHHPQAVLPSLNVHCDCRKPRPGLLLRAAGERDVDLARSYIIGDQETDVEAGLAAGCTTVLVNDRSHPATGNGLSHVRPHQIAKDILAAVEIIQQLEGGGRWRSS